MNDNTTTGPSALHSCALQQPVTAIYSAKEYLELRTWQAIGPKLVDLLG